jgi:hypothetical protein
MTTINCTLTFDTAKIELDRGWVREFLLNGDNFSLEQLDLVNDETLLSYLQEEGLEEFCEEYGVEEYPTPVMISVTPEEEPSEEEPAE